MPTPRRHHAWAVGVAVVALVLIGLAPGARGAGWHSPPTARAASSVGHTGAPSSARPASIRHASASTPSLQHLDLTTTPATQLALPHAGGWLTVPGVTDVARRGTAVIPHGRAPPAL